LTRDPYLNSRTGGGPHSSGQSDSAFGLGRHSKERAHGTDLILIFFHASVESAAVFGADQSLRRSRSFGDVRHIQTVLIDHLVEVLTAFFLHAKPMNLLAGLFPLLLGRCQVVPSQIV
jgi:hypothetical protein